MHKYKSNNSHYLEFATSNFNFGNIKKITDKNNAFTHQKATVR